MSFGDNELFLGLIGGFQPGGRSLQELNVAASVSLRF